MIPTSPDAACDFAQDVRAGEVAIGLAALVRQAKALERLGAAIIGIDEVALEMRRQHARRRARRVAARRELPPASSGARAGAQAIDVGQKAVTP